MVHIEVPTSDATIGFDIPLSTLIMKMSAKTQTTAGLKPKVSINRNLYSGNEVTADLSHDQVLTIRAYNKPYAINLKKIKFNETMVGRILLQDL